MTEAQVPVWLVRGDDPILVGEEVRRLVGELVGAADHALVVEDLSGDEYEIAAVVDAAQTPPFLSDLRVVVARDVGRFRTEEVAPLVAYLDDPLATTSVVLVGGGGQMPRSLTEAVKKVGRIVDAGVPHQARARQQWIAERLAGASVALDREAASMLGEHLGEDMGRLSGILELLEAAYGAGGTVGVEELTPFLGEAGSVAPWELTDAIDRGDTGGALAALRRLLDAGDRHPLQITASLHGHYGRMLRLEGATVADEGAAAALLGLKGSTFPAKKALQQVRRLGHAGVARAIALLAQADLDLKGVRDLPGEVVLEVLVARLSRLAPARAGRR